MQMGMNRIIPIPNKSNALLHPTICIMNHLTLPTKEQEQKNAINRNENGNQQQPNILFKIIASLTNAAMQD